MNSTPAIPMLARQNDDGVSVNESALCIRCAATDEGADEAAWMNWSEAGDVTPSLADSTLYPIDNPDGICNGCEAKAEFPAP